MYIAIDRDNLKFLHKHRDPLVVVNLTYIENPSVSVNIQPCDTGSFLKDFTDLELKLLYNHTCRSEQKFYGDSLRAILCAATLQFPEFTGNKYQLEQQAASVPVGCTKKRIFADGACTSAIMGDLYEPPELAAVAVNNEAAVAKLGLLHAAAQHLSSVPATVKQTPVPPASVAPAPVVGVKIPLPWLANK